MDKKRLATALRTTIVVSGLTIATTVAAVAIPATANVSTSLRCGVLDCGSNHNQVLL